VLYKEIPFLRIGLPLCAGIVSGLYFSPGNLFFVLSGAAILLSFFASLFFNRYLTNLAYGISLNIALYTCGLFLYTKEKGTITALEPEEAIFTGCLTDYPEEKENTYKLIYKIDNFLSAGNQKSAKGSLLLYSRKDSSCPLFLPGDRMVIRCTPIEITSRGNPFEFDYRFYMETQGIRYYAFTDSNDIINHSVPEHRKLRYNALKIRNRIIDMFRERGIKGERLALVAAITLGQKNMLDPEQKQHFIKAGVMHIMAVSGLHAVILSLFIFKLLFFLKGRLSILRVIITISILWLFAFITGLTPSVLRATLMFSFLQAGSLLKRPVNGINSVLASAFVLILIRPSVIFDAGFLLSYSAVIYIICFYRDLYLKIRFNHRIPDLIWQSAAVTIIAQAGTLPLTVMLFNRFPTWFILSNIIIVPLSSVVIIIGCLLPLTFPVHFLSQFLAIILDKLTGLTELLTEKASSLPFSAIENIGLTTINCILLTITIFLFTFFILRKKSIPVLYPLSALLLLVLSGTIRVVSTKSTNELIVYNTIGYSATGVRTGRILNLYSDTCVVGPEVSKHCATLNLKAELNNISGTNFCIRTEGNNILITNYLNNSVIKNTSPDIVILRGRPYIGKDIKSGVKPQVVVISPEVSLRSQFYRMVKAIKADSVHYVREQGAFYLRL
jgi:competence protein ComEC